MNYKQTPSQTIGPYFAYGLTPEQYGYPFKSIIHPQTTYEDTPGERICVMGKVLDGEGKPVNDAMIEIWQSDSLGNYPASRENKGFKGFARVGTGTDPENRFRFDTIKPGVDETGCAPHLNVLVFMRGLLTHLYTRIYFSDEETANAGDPVLGTIEESRRKTLIANRNDSNSGILYSFDIHMQGDQETVFFDV